MKNKDKEIIRKMIWDSLTDNNLILPPKPAHSRIPNFKGSTAAVKLLKSTEEWRNSEVIFSSPDSAQKKVREYALKDKKALIMASPKLKHGYILINPIDALNMEKAAPTIDGAFKYGNPIKDFPKVDMVIEGFVAVDLEGNRLGKEGWYGDMEISHLYHQKAIDNKTPIITTVHETQIVDKVPTEDHDEIIDMIITPKRMIKVNR